MQLKQIAISNFRNLKRVELELHETLNVIHGANGQGKSNILEAVFYLVTGRSFRSHLDSAALPHELEREGVARIEGLVKRADGGRNRLAVALGQNVKRIWIDDKPVGQLGRLWGRLRAVLFTPDDLNVLKRGPALRRRLIDIAVSQIDPGYLTALQNYTQALRQRNALLRGENSDRTALRDQAAAFNRPLAQWGAAIHGVRARFIAELSGIAGELYAQMTPSSERLTIQYLDAFKDEPLDDEAQAEERLLHIFEASLAQDLRRRQTMHGIHREDLHVALDGHDIRHYGSQGQQRTAMLAMRLAELELMTEWSGEAPILLLDDLASELDAERRALLLELIQGRAQTILTTTDLALVGASQTTAQLFHIRNGAVV